MENLPGKAKNIIENQASKARLWLVTWHIFLKQKQLRIFVIYITDP